MYSNAKPRKSKIATQAAHTALFPCGLCVATAHGVMCAVMPVCSPCQCVDDRTDVYCPSNTVPGRNGVLPVRCPSHRDPSNVTAMVKHNTSNFNFQVIVKLNLDPAQTKDKLCESKRRGAS